MARAPTYTHEQGRVLHHGQPIGPVYAAALLDSHRQNAAMDRRRRYAMTAAISERLASELETAMEAARIFNAAVAKKPTAEQERQRLAARRRLLKTERQAKGMVG
jgi:hypothetical protein